MCCKVETFRAFFKNAIQLLLTETRSQDTFEMSCALLTFYRCTLFNYSYYTYFCETPAKDRSEKPAFAETVCAGRPEVRWICAQAGPLEARGRLGTDSQ